LNKIAAQSIGVETVSSIPYFHSRERAHGLKNFVFAQKLQGSLIR
jgi:hypothetical protein